MPKRTKGKKPTGSNKRAVAPGVRPGKALLAQCAERLKVAYKYVVAGNHVQGRDICQQVLNRIPKHPDATLLIATMEWKEGEREQAIQRLKTLLENWPRHIEARKRLAHYLSYLSRHQEAVSQHEMLRKLRPDSMEPIEGIAVVHESAGDFEAARAVIAPYLNTARETPRMGMILAKVALNGRQYEKAAETARLYLDRQNTPDAVRVELLYVLGQALERTGDIDGSFAAYKEAHQYNRPPFDRPSQEDMVNRLMRVFSSENVPGLSRSNDRSERPIFIACRPRSGSTLLERIIGAHPDVHDAGELVFILNMIADIGFTTGSTEEFPECVLDFEQSDVDMLGKSYLDYIHGITAAASRVTNKYLGNWLQLGLVELLWPGARILDLRRNPIDNCFACYTVNLGPSHAFSYDLGDLGFAYRQYERLMDHWHSVLSIPMLKVNYEDLVEDTDGWARKIIDFCGLEWDDRCLEFHKHGGKGSASFTLSYAQVRQPVYKTSVNRAEKFKKHLGPLYEALGLEQ